MDPETGTATPRSPVSCTLRFRDHKLVQDKPPENGGDDEGPMASEFLLGALLACQHSTFHKIAAKRNITTAPARIEGSVHFDDRGDIDHMELDWHFHTDCEGLETAIKLTDKACTISKAISVPVQWRHHCDQSAGSAGSKTPAAEASSR